VIAIVHIVAKEKSAIVKLEHWQLHHKLFFQASKNNAKKHHARQFVNFQLFDEKKLTLNL
jgi:hypothetical protein